MNLTDVGHLTGDNEGDADIGEDRMEKSAKKEGKTVWEVAEFYTDVFLKDFDKLNLEKPEVFAKATDHIKEQIDLIIRLEKKGYTYQTSDGIYFDTSKFPEYGKLSNLDQIKEGARVEINPEKRNPRDFALWKFSNKKGERPADEVGEVRQRRQMEWKSPWGVGFPGWHIECSAMSMKYLGESFDIHTGGTDLRETHHPNEIAQSEAATGKQFVRYWVHSAFILINGERMSKSKGNLYRLYDLEKEARLAEDSPRSGGAGGESRRGYDPLALRYLYLQTHYRQEMNFTFPALEAAQNALRKLLQDITTWEDPAVGSPEHEEQFLEAINDDLNMPKALSVMWDLVKSDVPSSKKAKSLFKIDQVLGFNLREGSLKLVKERGIIPDNIMELVKERDKLRGQRRFNAADHIRAKIGKLGYEIEDSKKGTKVRKK